MKSNMLTAVPWHFSQKGLQAAPNLATSSSSTYKIKESPQCSDTWSGVNRPLTWLKQATPSGAGLRATDCLVLSLQLLTDITIQTASCILCQSNAAIKVSRNAAVSAHIYRDSKSLSHFASRRSIAVSKSSSGFCPAKQYPTLKHLGRTGTAVNAVCVMHASTRVNAQLEPIGTLTS